MATKDDVTRQVWSTALLAVGLTAALVFGILVLTSGDWIPGTVIVVASAIALARLVPVIAGLRRQTPPSPPPGGPTA